MLLYAKRLFFKRRKFNTPRVKKHRVRERDRDVVIICETERKKKKLSPNIAFRNDATAKVKVVQKAYLLRDRTDAVYFIVRGENSFLVGKGIYVCILSRWSILCD